MVGENMTLKEELEAILNEELEALEKLFKLAEEKTDIILGNDINRLQLTMKEEEQLINLIGTLEIKRTELLDSWGVNIETPISDVINKLPEDAEELVHTKERLELVLKNLKERNDINNSLILENLSWIDFNINLMTDATTPQGYGSDASDREKKSNSIFDRKV